MISPTDWRQLGAVKRSRAAEILGGISIKSVDELARSGALHTRPVGRRVLVTVHSLRAYLGEVAPLPVAQPIPPHAEARAKRLESLDPRVRKVLAEARRRLGG